MKKFQIEISDEEQKYLENDLLDIGAWITGAVVGKIHNCMKRAAREYEQYAKASGLTSIPVKDEDKAKALFALPTYKNRAARDAEEKLKMGL